MTKDQLHKVIGENIKIQRIRHGMTQSDLAEFLDIQPEAILNYILARKNRLEPCRYFLALLKFNFALGVAGFDGARF